MEIMRHLAERFAKSVKTGRIGRSVLALAACVVTACGFAWIFFAKSPSVVGARLPNAVLTQMTAGREGRSDRFLVIYGDSSSSPAERAFRYVQVRTASSLPVLPALLISDRNLHDRMAAFHLACNAPCKDIEDRWGFYRALLGLRSHSFHVFVVQRDGRILFSGDFADTSDIQLLTDKFLLGKIDYAKYESHDPASLLGKQVTPFNALRVVDNTQVELPTALGAARSFLLFTAHCPDCSLDGLVRASSIVSATDAVHVDHGAAGNGLVLLFSSRFNSDQLRRLISSTHSPNRVYQANGSIPALENLADLTVSAPADICLVRLSSDSTITGVTSFVYAQGTLKVMKEHSYGDQI